MSEVQQLARKIDSGDPEVGLQAVAALRRLLEDLEAVHVHQARERGWSWGDVARSLGVTRQSVHKKHGSHDRR